jgi:uncharacterized protein YcbK (DUF882 family)
LSDEMSETNEMRAKRRDFLKLAVGAGALALMAPPWARAQSAAQGQLARAGASGAERQFAAQSDALFWSQPRVLRLSRGSQVIESCYWANNAVNWEGYAQICRLMADLHQGVAVQMDPRLMDLMRAVQAYVAYYGYTEPMRIDSGFRTLETNSRLEGAARNSMHLFGKAVDFVMPGLPSDYMGLLASHYRGGGVGFYSAQRFTHMDTGNVRYWVGRGSRPPALPG